MRPLLTALLTLAATFTASAADVGFPRFPSLSPNGEHIAFRWADDIWIHNRATGATTRVTSHPAQEGRSAFSPSGALLAFESNRDGARNLYTIDLKANTPPRRVTISDRDQNLSGFTNDGAALLFSASQEPSLFRHERMYRAPLDAGPVTRLTDAYGVAPRMASTGAILFVRGYPYLNRPEYRGPGARSIWHFTPETNDFEQLSTFTGNEYDPHQTPDGSVVFISSRTGDNNVFRLTQTPDGDVIEQLTDFAPPAGAQTIGHGVRHLAVSRDGSTAAFCVWDTLYTLDLNNPDALPQSVKIEAPADSAIPSHKSHNLSTEADEAALHPSGKAVAIVARGELFIRSATEEDRPARRITDSSAREGDLAWSPDGETLYFVRDDAGGLGSIFTAKVNLTREDLIPEEAKEAEKEDESDEDTDEEEKEDEGPDYGKRWAEALSFDIQPLIDTPAWERAPRPSPHGNRLLYTRGLGDLMHVVLPSNSQDPIIETTVFSGWNAPDAHWIGNSRLIIYEVADLNFNSDIYLTDPLDQRHTGAINLTRHPDMDVSPRISRDGKVLTFLSDRDNENWQYDVYAIYLDEKLERMTDYELDKHFKDAAKKMKDADFFNPDADQTSPYLSLYNSLIPGFADEFGTLEDAYLRVRRLTSLPGAESSLAITPAGDRVLFEAEIDDERALHSIDFRGEERKTITTGNVSNVAVSLTGDKALFIKGGKAHTAPVDGGDADAHPVDHTIRVNLAEEQLQKFREAAGRFGATFYHPTLKGLDWPKLTERYAQLAAKVRTPTELKDVFTLMLGEVEGSHTAIRGGPSYGAPSPANGYLAIDASPAPNQNGYRVDRVLENGPSYIAPLDLAGEATGLNEGEVITAINNTPLMRNAKLTDLHAALAGTRNSETLITITTADTSETSHALITPHSFAAENNLRYTDAVLARRAEVERLSNGRLGYLHIRAMGAASVRDFERDLFAAADGKDALVIDVRDNGGGYTTDILLASLTAPRHAYTIPRGADADDVPHDAYPRDRRLIYGWSRPINVLINQNSFSNAEIFAHSIKTIGRGTLVGTQTFGGVISTGGFPLIDGTWVRQPFRGWYLTDGTDMESNGAIPHLPIEQRPEHEAAGVDPQLEAAVEELLSRIDN